MEEYNQSLKSRISSQPRRQMQMDLFVVFGDVDHLQQINVRDGVNGN